MKSAFLDVNVLLDILLNREGFVDPVKKIFELKDNGELNLYTSAVAGATIAYFLKKYGKDPFNGMKELLYFVDIVEVNQDTFEDTITSGFKDFEDALHYYAATRVKGLDAFLTRNVKDFRNAKIPVMTPGEFLSTLEQSGV